MSRLYAPTRRECGRRGAPPPRSPGDSNRAVDDFAAAARASGNPYHVKADEAREGLTAKAASRMWPTRATDHSMGPRRGRPLERPSSAPAVRAHGPAHAIGWEPSCEEVRQRRRRQSARSRAQQHDCKQQPCVLAAGRRQHMSARSAVAESLRAPSEALRSLSRDPLTRSARAYKMAVAEHRPSTAQSIHEAKLTAPGLPFITQVEPLSVDTVRITWRQPLSDGGSPLTGFRLQFREVSAPAETLAIICTSASPADLPAWAKADDPDRAKQGSKISYSGDSGVAVGSLSTGYVSGGDTRQVELTHLQPAGSYAVRLSAGNGVGFGRWTVFQSFDLPTKLGLRVERARSAEDGLLVHWTLPTRSTPIAFELQFKPHDQSAATEDDDQDGTKTIVVKASASRVKQPEQQEAIVKELVTARQVRGRRSLKKARRCKVRKSKQIPTTLLKVPQTATEPGAAEHEVMLAGLKKHTFYSLRMREIYADERVGRWTPEVLGRTLPPAPRAPAIVKCDVSSKTITVNWETAEEDETCRYHLNCIATENGSSSTVKIDRAEIVVKQCSDEAGSARGRPLAHRCTVDRLRPGTEYSLQVVAQNLSGSTPSEVVSANTEPHEAVPRLRQVSARSHSSDGHDAILVSWQLEDLRGPAPENDTAFQIEYRRLDAEVAENSSEWHREVFPANTLSDNPDTLTQDATVSDKITPSTSYVVRVRAVCSFGEGQWKLATHPVQTQVSRPQDVAVDATATSVSVTWRMPSIYGDGSDLQYEVQASPVDNSGEIGPVCKHVSAFATCSCEVQGLVPAQRYAIQVRAQRNEEVSQLSTICYVRTAAAVVQECAASSPNSVDLTWRLERTVPVLVNGWTLQYRIREQPNAMMSVTDDAYPSTTEPAHLQHVDSEKMSPSEDDERNIQGNDYRASFSGDSSRRCARPFAKKSPGNRSSVKRALPAGAMMNSLQVEASSRSIQLTNLMPGRSYSWRVVAQGENGQVFASPWEMFFTKGTVPQAPIVLRRKVTDTVVAVFFSTPEDMGSPVESFEADLEKFGGQHDVKQLPPDADHCVFTDLEPGVSYTLRLRARNAHGWCTTSNAVALMTSRFTQVPEAPTIRFSDIRNTSLMVNLDLEMPEVSSSIHHYQVEYREVDGFREWSIQKADRKQFHLQKLTPGRHFEVRAYSVNDSGQSPYSDIETVSTQAGVPTPPETLSLSSVGTEEATLCWSPADPRGDPVRQYCITFCPVGAPLEKQDKSIPGDAASTVLRYLEPSTQYSASIYAVNDVGASATSGQILFRTLTDDDTAETKMDERSSRINLDVSDDESEPSTSATSATADEFGLADEGIGTHHIDLVWNSVKQHSGAKYVVEMALDTAAAHAERIEVAGATPLRLDRVVGVLGGIQLEGSALSEVNFEATVDANMLLVDEIELALGQSANATEMWMPVDYVDCGGQGELRCAITDLAPDSWYQFRVRCEDGGVEAACSSTLVRRTNIDTAGNLVAANGLVLHCDEPSSVSCSWSAPANSDSHTRFEIRYRSSASGRRQSAGPWQRHFTDLQRLTLCGFDPGSRVEVSVRPWTADTVGAWSGMSAICTNFTVPSPPRLLLQHIRANAATISVVWKLPKTDGGKPIEKFEVRCRKVGLHSVEKLVSQKATRATVQSLTVGDLQPQSRYELCVRATNGVGWSEWSSMAAIATQLPTIVADIRTVLSVNPLDPWRLYQLLLAEVIDSASGEGLEDNYWIAHRETLAEAVRSADLGHWLIFRQFLPSSAQPRQFLIAEDGTTREGDVATAVKALRTAILWGDRGAVVSLVLPAPGKENQQAAISLLAHEYYNTYGFTIVEHLKGRFLEVQEQEQQPRQEDNTNAFGLVSALEYALNKATADSPVGASQVDEFVGDLEKLFHKRSGGADSKAAVAAMLCRLHQLTSSQRHGIAALYEKRHARRLCDIGGGSPSAEVMAWGAFRGFFSFLLDTRAERPSDGEAVVEDIATQLVQLLKVASDDLALGQPRATQAVERICRLLLDLPPSQLPAVSTAYAAGGGGNLQRDLVSNFLLDGKGLIYLLQKS